MCPPRGGRGVVRADVHIAFVVCHAVRGPDVTPLQAGGERGRRVSKRERKTVCV